MRNILVAVLVLFLSCSVSAGEFDVAGDWNIEGQGFAEKGVVRVHLDLKGTMTLETKTLNEISADYHEIYSGDKVISLDMNLLDGNMKALTSYDLYLRLTASSLNIKAWDEDYPSYIRIPVLLPEEAPTAEMPYVLPKVTVEDITYVVSLESANSGKVRMNGYIDIDTIGECELNADNAIWRAGTPKPQMESETSSGCNSGFGLISLLVILMGVIRIVRD